MSAEPRYDEPPAETGGGAVRLHGGRLVRSWRTTAPLVVGGLVLGVAAASLVPPTYTAEARLVVGGQTLATQSVPGVVFATQELAATYSRYVDDASATGRLEELIGPASRSVSSVAASPIPDSSVMILEVGGSDPSDVRDAAQALADALVEQVETGSEVVATGGALTEYEEVSGEVAAQQVLVQSLRTELDVLLSPDAEIVPPAATVDALRADIVTAESRLSVLTLRQEELGARYLQLAGTESVELTVVRPAEATADNRTLLWLGGGLVGAALGAGLALLAASRSSRHQPVKAALPVAVPTATPQVPARLARWERPSPYDRVEPGRGEDSAPVRTDDVGGAASPTTDPNDPFSGLRGPRSGSRGRIEPDDAPERGSDLTDRDGVTNRR